MIKKVLTHNLFSCSFYFRSSFILCCNVIFTSVATYGQHDQLELYTTWSPSSEPIRLNFRNERGTPKLAGRINAISCQPRDGRVVLVGSELGGAFRSDDNANTFSSLPSLDKQKINDIKFIGSGTIAIATTDADFKSVVNKTIWKSNDGGINWVSTNDHLNNPPNNENRINAYCIDEDENSSLFDNQLRIYVGNNQGLAVSDGGENWQNFDIFSGIAGSDPTVKSVKVLANGIVLAGGPQGVLRWDPENPTWLPVHIIEPTSSPVSIDAVHGIDGVGSVAFFVTSDLRIFESIDAGANWRRVTMIPTPNAGAGGNAFIKLHLRNNDPNNIELFASNTYNLQRIEGSRSAANSGFAFGSWTSLHVDHSDIHCIAFKRNEPFLLGSDGGLHVTLDGGATWRFTAGSSGGLSALLIYEVNGQFVLNSNRHNLYIGTQDNNLWASDDNGASWSSYLCCEGYYIQCLPRVQNEGSAKINCQGVDGGQFTNFVSGPFFHDASYDAWRNPSSPIKGAPVILSENAYIQPTLTPNRDDALAITFNGSNSWQPFGIFASLNGQPATIQGQPKGVFGRDQIIAYQPVRMGYDQVSGMEIVQLIRINSNQDGSFSTVSPVNEGLGGLGMYYPTYGFPVYEVFAVDPGRALHLIAVDAIRGKVVQTYSGGERWHDIPTLDQQLTHNGYYHFNLPENKRATIVSAISFCPDNPKYVLLGTVEGGIYSSSNGGETWEFIQNSDQIRPVSSFYWRTWNDVFVSTYGRGLWRLRGASRIRWQSQPSLINQQLQNVTVSIPSIQGQPPISHLMFNGIIMGLEFSGNVLKRIYVSPGTSHLIVTDYKMGGDEVEIVESTKEIGFIGLKEQPKIPSEGWIPVGLTFQKEGFMEITYAPKPIEFPGIHEKTILEPHPLMPFPFEKVPYIHLTHIMDGKAESPDNNSYKPDETIVVHGWRFEAESVTDLAVILNGTPIKVQLKWSGDNEFEFVFKAPNNFGLHTLVVTQKMKQYNLTDASTFSVHPVDMKQDGK